MMTSLLTRRRNALELGEYIGASAIVVSIFLATVVFIWQSGRSDAKIDRLDARIDRLDAKIEAQGDRLDAKIDKLDAKLDAKIEAFGQRLSAEIKEQGTEIREQGRRVSEAELEQARLNGVNSVIVNQIHSHGGPD